MFSFVSVVVSLSGQEIGREFKDGQGLFLVCRYRHPRAQTMGLRMIKRDLPGPDLTGLGNVVTELSRVHLGIFLVNLELDQHHLVLWRQHGILERDPALTHPAPEPGHLFGTGLDSFGAHEFAISWMN